MVFKFFLILPDYTWLMIITKCKNMILKIRWYRIPRQGREQTQALQHPRLQESSGWESFLSEFSLLDILGPQCWWIGSPQLRDQVGGKKIKITQFLPFLFYVQCSQNQRRSPRNNRPHSLQHWRIWRDGKKRLDPRLCGLGPGRLYCCQGFTSNKWKWIF